MSAQPRDASPPGGFPVPPPLRLAGRASTDRNPQTFTDIPRARPEEFRTATQRKRKVAGRTAGLLHRNSPRVYRATRPFPAGPTPGGAAPGGFPHMCRRILRQAACVAALLPLALLAAPTGPVAEPTKITSGRDVLLPSAPSFTAAPPNLGGDGGDFRSSFSMTGRDSNARWDRLLALDPPLWGPPLFDLELRGTGAATSSVHRFDEGYYFGRMPDEAAPEPPPKPKGCGCSVPGYWRHR